MGNVFVQKEEPKAANLVPGDEWFPPKDEPFFHKVWTGVTMGWNTGGSTDYPEPLVVTTEEEVEEKRAAEADVKAQEEAAPSGEAGKAGGEESGGEPGSEESDNGDEDEETDDGDEAETSDSDGDDEGSGGESGSKPKKRGKRKGLLKRR